MMPTVVLTFALTVLSVVSLLGSTAQAASSGQTASAPQAATADTTWIEGTVTSYTKRPLRVAHVMLRVPDARTTFQQRGRIALGPLDETPRSPIAVVSADAKGKFRLATVEKGPLLLRITSPDHATVEWPVYCSGGHTINVAAVASAHLKPSDEVDTVSVVTRDSTFVLKREGKGLYGATIKTKDSIIEYYLVATIRGSNVRILGVGGPVAPTATEKGFAVAPDDDGVYWSAVRSSEGAATIQANTSKWLRSKALPSVTFLSRDDATIDSLIARIGHRGNAQTPAKGKRKTFDSYSERSDRVRQVAAIAYTVHWDTLKTVVPPTSPAWTVGHIRFFDLLMNSGSNAETWDYIDTLLMRHPVRRIIPAMQSAVIGYAYRSGKLDRSKMLLQKLMQEFPTHPQTREIRHFADPERPIQVGKMMPEFDWAVAEGTPRRITRDSLKGSHALFFIWDSRALTSSTIDDLRRLQTTFKTDGLTMIGILAGNGALPPAMASVIQTHPWPTVYSDGSPQSPVAVLDIRAPFMILVGKEGTIVSIIGGLNVAEAEKVLRQQTAK